MDKSNVNSASIFAMLKQIAALQAQSSKLNMQIMQKQSKEHISKKIDGIKTNIDQTAKKYGVNDPKKAEEDYLKNRDEKDGIIEKYNHLLEDLDAQYDIFVRDINLAEQEAQKSLIESKTNQTAYTMEYRSLLYNNKKICNDLKKQIQEANKKGDNAKIIELANKRQEVEDNPEIKILREKIAHEKEMQKQIRQMIEECDSDLIDIEIDRETAIDTLIAEQNTSLANIPKQNIFAKTLGSLFAKFHGTQKFIKYSLEPLEKKYNYIKEKTYPAVKEKLVAKAIKIKEKYGVAKDTAVNIAQKGKDGLDLITEKNKQMKLNIIEKMEEKLKRKEESIKQKQNRLNPEVPQNDPEQEDSQR